MRTCCHPIPPQEWRRWLGNCRHSQISSEEKAQTRFDVRLSFYMTFCRQTLAPSESSGAMQLLSSQLALSEAEGTRACVWKSLCSCYQSWPWPQGSEGYPCPQTEVPVIFQSLLWRQVWLDSRNEMKSLKYSKLHHDEKLRGPTLSFCVL